MHYTIYCICILFSIVFSVCVSVCPHSRITSPITLQLLLLLLQRCETNLEWSWKKEEEETSASFPFQKKLELGKGLPAEFCRALISFSRKPNNLITTTVEADISDINDDDNDTNYGKDKDDDYKRSGAY